MRKAVRWLLLFYTTLITFALLKSSNKGINGYKRNNRTF